LITDNGRAGGAVLVGGELYFGSKVLLGRWNDSPNGRHVPNLEAEASNLRKDMFEYLCIPDLDGNGVVDSKDRSPRTETDERVDADGCSVQR
jgi:hypothetical protein